MHVRGQATGRVYSESAPIIVPSKVTVTSDYPGASALASWVTLSANGMCATGIRCAVRLEGGGSLIAVTVTPSTGPAAAGVLIEAGTPSTSGHLQNVVVRGATASGIVALGHARLNDVTSRNNAGHGLELTSSSNVSVSVVGTGLVGLRNVFTANGRSGISVVGRITVNGTYVEVTQNAEFGAFIDTPFTSTALSMVIVSGNRLDGLYVQNGQLTLTPFSGPSTINTNGGAGIRVGSGDPLVTTNSRLTLNATVGSRTAHSISANDGGGVDLRGPVGLDGGYSIVQSTTFTGNAGFGLRVAPTDLTPIRMRLWLDDFSRNGTPGLIFRRVTAANDDLVLIGDTIFGLTDGGSTNRTTAMCLDNASGAPWTLDAETNFWSVRCPLPLTDAGFQAPVVSCAQPPATYREILYTGPVAPITAVTTCR